MKSIYRTIGTGMVSLCLVTIAQAQTTPAASPAAPATSTDKSSVAGATNSARTDVYHVHFAHAAPGKVAQLGEALKTPGPNPPAGGHMIVLRHQQGDAWDYAVISHYGTKFTVEAAGPQLSTANRDLSDWHSDTICSGPAWSDFARALGIGDDAKKNSGAVYAVSTYRVVPGHRDDAEKFVGQAPAANDKTAGTVVMQHLEGSPWQFVAIARYNSWQDFGASQTNTVPETSKKDSPWATLREHIAFHTDTLCDRILP